MGNYRLEKKTMNLIIYLYLALPIVIFALGFCKWYFGLLTLAAVAVSIAELVFIKPSYDESEGTVINKANAEKLVLAAVIIGFWVYFSGIGKLIFQTDDHTTRNLLYEILVNYEWPVEDYGHGLAYYIGFWMPAAVWGKIFGLQAGYIFQMVWAGAGLWLVYYLICQRLHCVKLWPLIVFMGFSGLDWLGNLAMYASLDDIWGNNVIEWWSGYWQFSSNTTQLFWVFNQCIYAWLAMMLILREKNNRSLIFILGCILITCPFPFVGLAIFAVLFMLTRRYKVDKAEYMVGQKGWVVPFLKDTITIPNIIGGGVTGLLTASFLMGNMAAGMGDASSLMSPKIIALMFAAVIVAIAALYVLGIITDKIGSATLGRNIIVAVVSVVAFLVYNKLMFATFGHGEPVIYITFIFFEVGVYWIAVYEYQKKKPEYWVMMATLLFCPLIEIGVTGDFCMRASIPALTLLTIMVIETIRESNMAKNYIVRNACIILLILGCVTPMHELLYSVERTVISVSTGANFVNGLEYVHIEDIMQGYNFSTELEGSFFYNYVAK